MLLCLQQVKLYTEKRSDLEEQQLHLNVGLQKIRDTVQQVEELQKSLSIKRIELEEKNNAANQKLKQMVGFMYTPPPPPPTPPAVLRIRCERLCVCVTATL